MPAPEAPAPATEDAELTTLPAPDTPAPATDEAEPTTPAPPEVTVSNAPTAPDVTVSNAPAPPEVTVSNAPTAPEVTVWNAPAAPEVMVSKIPAAPPVACENMLSTENHVSSVREARHRRTLALYDCVGHLGPCERAHREGSEHGGRYGLEREFHACWW